MSLSDEFMAFVLDQFSDWGGVTARKMFGGAGLYRDGIMFGLIADDVVCLKVNDSNRLDFIQAGSAPFKPYPGQAASMSYYEVPLEVLEDREMLTAWAVRSLGLAKSRG
ncbi:MAG TPA: TfoX/Sxy family protein [Candidatus Hydrogenedentes bacterium]|jgi:DNA transformation protein|nr:MAG: hypothetical protein BWX80_02495 [Candidatus Hydrogenedentes bacterium ADurb.Bin101]HOC70729.1 TfoX/Sxy family protein [Candidatus Hydrogenedentota bacterium]HQN00065.1 TfoX/Sxy family protein [Candidatus Hydrogenedentota bacterium]